MHVPSTIVRLLCPILCASCAASGAALQAISEARTTQEPRTGDGASVEGPTTRLFGPAVARTKPHELQAGRVAWDLSDAGTNLLLSGPPDPVAISRPPPHGALGQALSGAQASPAQGADRQESHEYANIYPGFSISLGALLASNFHSSVNVSGSSGPGVSIDMEELLDVDQETTVGEIDAHYSFNDRHWIDASYYDIQRSGSTDATTQDISFGDISIPAGSRVDSDFNTRIIKIAYRYNFVTDQRTVIGASIGVHSMGLAVKLKAAALSTEETFRQELPLPLIGLHGAYALSRKWSLLADAEFLQFDLGSYRGFVSDNRLALNHDTLDHFGWGLSLGSFRLNGAAEGDGGLKADLEYGYQAVMLYLRFYL